MKKQRILYGLIFFALLLTEVYIALYVKNHFIRAYFGDVLVTILLCSFCRFFIPKKGLISLPIFIFLFSVAVEISQYLDLVEFLGFENNVFLCTLMGQSFSYIDIICYAAGCVVFFLFDMLIAVLAKKKMA